MTPVARPPTVDERLAASERLIDQQRTRAAIRQLSGLLEHRDTLTDDQRVRALHQRLRALMMLGLDRRAWADVRALPPSPTTRALEAELWVRNAPPDRAREAIRALARAHPTEVVLWQQLDELTPPNFDRVGHHAEVALGLAQDPDVNADHLIRTADMLARSGARRQAERILDRVPEPSAEQFQRIVRIRARIRMAIRDADGLRALLDHIEVHGLDDLLEVYRWHLATGAIDVALELLRQGEPTPMDPRWLRATVMLLCQMGRLDAAGTLAQTHGTPGDDAHVVWWAATGDQESIRRMPAVDAIRPWPVRLIHEAEAWLEHSPTHDRANQLLQRALRHSTETNPTIALNQLRIRTTSEFLDWLRTCFAPLLPADFHDRSPQQAHRWLQTRAPSLLARLNGGRDELLIFRDDIDVLRVFHVPVDQRHDLVNLRAGLLDLGFESILKAYEDWRDRFGAPPLWYTHRAEVRLWSGDIDGARADLDAALAIDPDTRWAYVGLGLVHIAQGRPEAALRVLEQGIAQLGPLTSGWPVAAEALLRLGDRKKGRVELARAIEHRPYRLSIRIVEALYALADGHDATELIGSIARTYPRIWSVAEGKDDATRLESMLTMMGANRSSSLIVWRHPNDGWCLTQARALMW